MHRIRYLIWCAVCWSLWFHRNHIIFHREIVDAQVVDPNLVLVVAFIYGSCDVVCFFVNWYLQTNGSIVEPHKLMQVI